MKVIEGKQVVLRPYLTEAQCVRPVTEQDVKPGKPVECIPQKVLITEAGTGSLREHRVQMGTTKPLQTKDLMVEDMPVKPFQTVSVGTIATTIHTGQVLSETAGEELTIEELFYHQDGQE